MAVYSKFLITLKLCLNTFLPWHNNPRCAHYSIPTYGHGSWFLFLLCLLFFQPNATHAQEHNTDQRVASKNGVTQPLPPSEQEKNTDREFLSKKSAILEDFKKQKTALTLLAKNLEAENEGLQKQVKSLSSTLLVREDALLFLNLTNFGISIILWFFPLLVLNHFLYLFFRKKDFFIRHRTLLITAFAVVEICFFLPLICSAQEVESPPTRNQPPDPFVENLQKVDRLIKMSPAERNIYILVHTSEETVTLEKVDTKDPFLSPSGGSVEIKSPDYYYTLAALYRQLGKEEMVLKNLKALDALPLKPRWLKQYAFIYLKVLEEYLDKNRLENATDAARRLIDVYGAQKDVTMLIDLSTFLIERKMNTSAGEALKEACAVAHGSDQVISLAKYLLKNHRNSELAAIIKQAIERTQKLRNVMPLLKFCIENGLTEETSLSINRAMETSRSVEDDLTLARFLFEKGRKQACANVLAQAREKATSLPLLMEISNAAKEQGFLSSAIKCVERAILVDRKKALDYQLPPPHLLDASRSLPSLKSISLPTYLGILQQVEKKLEKADFFYKFALMEEINAIIRSYGYKITGNINEFYYLKQLWTETHSENLKFLLPIYAHLQENMLEKERITEEKEIGVLSEQVEQLKKKRAELLETRDAAKSRVVQVSIAVSLYSLRDLAIVLTIIIILTGCAIKGVQAAKAASDFKFFVFFWKFLESIGWSTCFSVAGIPFGIPLVVVSQLLIMIQFIQQQSKGVCSWQNAIQPGQVIPEKSA